MKINLDELARKWDEEAEGGNYHDFVGVFSGFLQSLREKKLNISDDEILVIMKCMREQFDQF